MASVATALLTAALRRYRMSDASNRECPPPGPISVLTPGPVDGTDGDRYGPPGPKLHSDPTDDSTALTVFAVAVILVGGRGVSARRRHRRWDGSSSADAEWGSCEPMQRRLGERAGRLVTMRSCPRSCSP